MEVGAKVCAISHTIKDEKKVCIFGYGTYAGEEIPMAGSVGEMAEMLHEMNIKNPKIVLDNGAGIIYGCQCWWGSVEQVQQKYADWEFVTIENPNKHEPDTKAEG